MKKKARRTSPWKRFFGIVGYGFLLTVACGIGVIANMARQSGFVTEVIKNPFALLNSDPKKAFHDEDGLTLLVLGTDEDRVPIGFDGKHMISKVQKGSARADMILVAHLDFDHNRITGISVPRDTGCRLPGYPLKKINGYYNIAKKGEEKELMTQAVEHVLDGVKIDRTIAINYDAFKELVDIVGGVPVVVPKGRKGNGLHYDDFAGQLHVNLFPGPQTLNGDQAMGYVRFRHDSESDYGRQQRQKEFLTSFKSTIIRHPFQLPEVAEKSKEVMGNALTDQEIIALIAFSRKVPPASIKLGMLPVVERRGTTMLGVDFDKRESALREYGLIPSDVRTAQVSP